ncbi:MAG: glycoside hydrolase family 2 protein [Lachnospiraceae bacterium]|nr:glycoside hydrolase family 2 protein [Lachnospiraceae bacterium]
MKKTNLHENWQMKILGENVYGIKEDWIDVEIPGSVYGNLLAKDLMPDPYDGMNELDALKLMENDFCFQTTFVLTEESLEADCLLLRFEGIDTLSDIYLNDILLGHCDNMHRVWEYDILEEARAGENCLQVFLYSPTKYIAEENAKVYTGGSSECMEGFPHLRKAHCMFGWDWGPRLPDAGIFREVSLLEGHKARFEQVYITQEWGQDEVTLVWDVTIEQLATGCLREGLPDRGCLANGQDGDSLVVKTALFGPDGELVAAKASNDAQNPDADKAPIDGEGCGKHVAPGGRSGSAGSTDGWDRITVANPQKWWPNGYGKQPLYTAKVSLEDGEGAVLDTWSRRIGLRTMNVNMDQDEWGECFAHEVNGVKIFAMGADYIPEDNILSRVTKERTRKLLEDAVLTNHNCIRVWGGGYYPDDWFYDACDELGLIVWQDFMFACAQYELDDAFERNVSAEIRDNVRRIRHHACLGLWCGNNEMETQTLDGAWRPSIKQKYDYIKLYEYIIPKIVQEEDPATFYWPSSPSSGGNFDNPWDEDRGDTHYWDVWHGSKPFTEYRKFYFRYLSEFGFQSFPCLKTVETFTRPAERNIFSRVMEMHQRNKAANGKILDYLSATYLYPKNFEMLLYASQLLQADAIRYGIEHFRRHRGRCMGTVVWQLNDIWPVASWSGIDYFGRWKALQYAEKRAFSPLMISCEEVGELSERPYCIAEPAPIEKSVRLHVANETMEPVNGSVTWELRSPDSTILLSGREAVLVPALDGVWLTKMDFSAYDELSTYFSCAFSVAGKIVSKNGCLFTAPKHFAFLDPKLSWRREGDALVISAAAFAKSVEIQGVDGDVKLEDNFFDMDAGERRVAIVEGDAKHFLVKSVYEIA